MRRDSAQLPVDFLVGFTIFILSLIMVANYVPSLLVGLQRTSGIDYDAVAYRTGVVLVEDPGEPAGDRVIGWIYPTDSQPWEQQANGSIKRLGLALTADTPNVLSINKIEKFFNSSFSNPTNYFLGDADYRNKMLFSSYQYGYNVTLRNISAMNPGGKYPNGLTMMLGQPYPAGYGYIRRYVVIKENTNTTLNVNKTVNGVLAYDAMSDSQVMNIRGEEEFRVRLDGKILYNKSIDPHLQIDLQREPFTIKITNLSNVLNRSDWNPSPIAKNATEWDSNPTEKVLPTTARLIAIRFYDSSGMDIPGYSHARYKIDGGSEQDLPATGAVYEDVMDTIELIVDPLWPPGLVRFDANQAMDIGFVFKDEGADGNIPHTLITGTLLYDYNPLNVTQPVLSTGMLEVGIW